MGFWKWICGIPKGIGRTYGMISRIIRTDVNRSEPPRHKPAPPQEEQPSVERQDQDKPPVPEPTPEHEHAAGESQEQEPEPREAPPESRPRRHGPGKKPAREKAKPPPPQKKDPLKELPSLLDNIYGLLRDLDEFEKGQGKRKDTAAMAEVRRKAAELESRLVDIVRNNTVEARERKTKLDSEIQNSSVKTAQLESRRSNLMTRGVAQEKVEEVRKQLAEVLDNHAKQLLERKVIVKGLAKASADASAKARSVMRGNRGRERARDDAEDAEHVQMVRDARAKQISMLKQEEEMERRRRAAKVEKEQRETREKHRRNSG